MYSVHGWFFFFITLQVSCCVKKYVDNLAKYDNQVGFYVFFTLFPSKSNFLRMVEIY